MDILQPCLLAAHPLVAGCYSPDENAITTLKPSDTLRPRPESSGTNSPIEKASLLAEAESLNNRFVALGIVFFEVVEQATPLADQHEKTAARAMVLQVRLEVVRQLTNAFAQQSDLDFWAARIGGVRSVLINDGFLLLSG
jgi:hypothetical protein